MALKVALSCLVLLLSFISFASMAKSSQCEYIVGVQAGDRHDAETDSIISLKLMSSSGQSITIDNLRDWGVMEPNHHYFRRGGLDFFGATRIYMDVCAITVTSNGEGDSPGWYLNFVEVIVNRYCKSTKVAFPVNQWLSPDDYTPPPPTPSLSLNCTEPKNMQ